MTVSYFALYQTPDDPAHFEQHYFGTHVPLIEKTRVWWRTGCTA